MSGGRTLVHCAVHGRSGQRGRAKCGLSSLVRQAWTRHRARGDDLIITGVSDEDPSHGAVCAADGDEEHVRAVLASLKSSIRVAKMVRTKAAKRKAS